MHPLIHIISSSIGIILLSILQKASPYTFLAWIGIGMVSTVIIDFDHLLIALVKGKKKVVLNLLSNPLENIKKINYFREKLYFPGFGVARLFTHMGEIILFFILSLTFIPSLTIPILISTIIHWVLDLLEIIIYPDRR